MSISENDMCSFKLLIQPYACAYSASADTGLPGLSSSHPRHMVKPLTKVARPSVLRSLRALSIICDVGAASRCVAETSYKQCKSLRYKGRCNQPRVKYWIGFVLWHRYLNLGIYLLDGQPGRKSERFYYWCPAVGICWYTGESVSVSIGQV